MSRIPRFVLKNGVKWARPVAKGVGFVSRWGGEGFKRVARMASMALAGVRKVRGLVNSEMFKLDTTITNDAITNSGLVYSASAVAQGDGQSARTGNSIFVRSLNIQGRLEYSTGGNPQQTVRIAVIMDTQQIGDTAPAYSDIYSAATPWSHLNPNNVGRFKVLKSRTMVVDPVGKTGLPFKFNIPMRHHIRYNGSASTDVQKGGLYIAIISDQATANYPTWSAEYRLSYHDN